jgi:acetyl esterase/lipase
MRHIRRSGRLLALLFGTALVASVPVTAQRAPLRSPFTVPLWSAQPPGAALSPKAEVFVQPAGDPIALVTHVQTPDLRVYLPPRAKANGTAIVIYPGGGYSVLAIDHEGWAVARWLNSIGVAAIVAKYRVSATEGASYRFPVPLLDARQALRVVRANATAWGIDPRRVGVMGFSAGGHLASMALTMPADTLVGDDVASGTAAHTPDFGVLVYPVITMHEAWGHRGSGDNLLGPQTPNDVRRRYSTELRVTGATPPTFLVATQDDGAVPPQNATAFYQAMTAAKVAGELHIWEKGGHGFGMLPDRPPVAQEWLPKLADWMRGRGLLRRTAAR